MTFYTCNHIFYSIVCAGKMHDEHFATLHESVEVVFDGDQTCLARENVYENVTSGPSCSGGSIKGRPRRAPPLIEKQIPDSES